MKKVLNYIKILICIGILSTITLSQVTQQWLAKYSHKSSSEDIINFLEVDNSRNIYVAGLTNTKFFVSKYNSFGELRWSNTYYENIDEDDFLGGLKVDALGNVYITANVLGPDTTYDIVTVKYNSLGSREWIARFKGTRTEETSVGIAIDSRGNVYVAGYQYSTLTKSDFILIKYNSTGALQWMRRENGIGNDDDFASAVIIDANNNIFVTGQSYNPNSFIDFMTIKFDSTGFTHWKVYYDGTGFDEDIPVTIGLDNFNNIYVLGSSYGDTTDIDFAVVKYNNSGSQQWAARYNSPLNMEDIPTAFRVTNAGAVYITGYTYDFLSSYDFLTVKVNSNGNVEWASKYDGSGNYDDLAYGIATDPSENVYITGSSFNIYGNSEISTIKYNAFGAQQWVIHYTLSNEFPAEAVGLKLDNLGGLVIGGYAFSLQNANDGVILKYNTSGVQQWSANINFFDDESFEDYPYDIKVDNSGNLYVVGTSYDNGTLYDFITIKYSNTGSILWSARYDGDYHDNDEAISVGVDKQKNVYVTGRSYSNNSDDDIVTLKYSENGNLIWQTKFNGSADSVDRPLKLMVDSLSNIIIVGYSYTTTGQYDIVTIKYNNQGQQLWTRYFNSSNNFDDFPTAVCLDKNGNIFIAAQVFNSNGKYDAALIKYNTAGTQEWVKYYNGPNNDNDIPTSVVADTFGNVIMSVASANFGTGIDIVLIKYNSSGIQSWIQTYNNSSNGYDYPKKISVIPNGDIYLGAWTENGSSFCDMLLLKYSAGGVKLWEAKYNGIYNDYDYLEDLYVDQWGNSYVSGTVENPTGKNNYVTLKYNSTGTLQWVVYYYDSYSTSGEVMAIAVDDLGDIFVTGVEYDSLDYSDIVTIMYKQSTYITGTVFFDVNNNGIKDQTDLPLAGWKVMITGAKKDSAITDSSGKYVFQNIPFGLYNVNQVLKSGWIQTMPISNYSIYINSGNLSGVLDFGNYSSNAVSYQVDGRWNLMSVPLRVNDRRKSTIFGSAASSAFAFDNGYIAKDTLNYMQGYWLKFTVPHTIWIAGTIFNEDSVEVKSGWNLIGNISYPVRTTSVISQPPGIITSAFYGYKNGYFMSDSLKPAQGYWVKVNQNGKLKIKTNLTFTKNETVEEILNNINKLQINDNDGNVQILYFTDLKVDETIREYLSAPPLPPSDAFDVRFSKGGYLFSSVDTKKDMIIITNASYPIKLSWDNPENLKYEIYDDSKSLVALLEGKSGTAIINQIPSGLLHINPIYLEKEKSIPEKFLLHQNYPNPFNSITLIKYELPKPDFVTIKIYNPLGEELVTLVNEFKQEGYHSVSFEAAGLPSGIYFCKMSTSEYTNVRKLILIK